MALSSVKASARESKGVFRRDWNREDDPALALGCSSAVAKQTGWEMVNREGRRKISCILSLLWDWCIRRIQDCL